MNIQKGRLALYLWNSTALAVFCFLLAFSGLSCISDSTAELEDLKAERDMALAQAVDEAITAGLKRSQKGISLSDGDKQYLLNVAHEVLTRHFSDNSIQLKKEDFPHVPDNILSQSMKIYITLLVDGRIRGCRSASKGNLLENTISATYRAISDERFRGELRKEELSDTKVDFTFVLKADRIKDHKLKKISKKIELGIHGIRLRNGRKSAFYKNSVPITHGYSLKTTLKKLGRKAKIGAYAYQDPNTKIYRYNTVQFTEVSTDKSLVDLYRSNLLVYQSDVDRRAHRKALRLCGDYMKNHVNEQGLLSYDYDTYRDKIDDRTSSVSVVRRLAATWILASIGDYFNDIEYKEAAKQSADYFFTRYYVYDPEQNFGYFKIGKDANLAFAAFMLNCLVTIDDDNFHPKEKQQLINFILAMEDKDKGFLYPVYLPDKQTNFARKEVYYPGEALTAIMLLYETTDDPQYLAVAERVFEYYRNLYDRSSKKASMSPWMSKAYTRVFFATGERKYADYVLKMNDYLLKSQKDVDEKYVDKIGSFFNKGSVYATGVMVESVLEAYRIAKALNDVERMQAYRNSVLMGNRFIIQSQYTEDNMFATKNRERTLGGIRTTIYTSKVRIDSVQHGACALLKTLEYVFEDSLSASQ